MEVDFSGTCRPSVGISSDLENPGPVEQRSSEQVPEKCYFPTEVTDGSFWRRRQSADRSKKRALPAWYPQRPNSRSLQSRRRSETVGLGQEKRAGKRQPETL